MGQYRFSIYAHWQLGFLFKVDECSIDVSILCITMHFALSKHARGVEIFNWYNN